MKNKKKKKLAVIIIIIVAVAAAAAFCGYKYLQSKMDKINREELDKSKVHKNEVKEETKQALKGYTTIALFGLDNRSTGYYERGNYDVIMVMSLNNETKEVQMVSIYRDTYVNIQTEDSKFRKANAAYAYGGPEGAISMLNKNFDLDIDNYVTFDFETVADAIDVLGGVDIEITSETELTQLNKYITHTNGILGTNADLVSGVGEHTLSGVQAVAFGRIRYTAGSDYRRAERHRQVLTELFKKAKKANLATLNKLVDTAFPKIKTDLTQKQITDMMSVMLDYDLKDSRGFPFEKNNITLPNPVGNIDVPCDLKKNVKELHQYLYGNDGYEPSDAILEYNQRIINDTGFAEGDEEKDRFSEIDKFDGNTGDNSTDSQEQ